MFPGNQKPRDEAFVFYEACWLTKEEAEYNSSLTPADEVKKGNAEMVDTISGAFRPLLRPNSEYKIEMKTTDTVNGVAKSPRSHVIAFRTKGPVGHFHEFPSGNGTKKHEKWVKERFTLEKLTSYVDMKRSYPAADGNLVGAKPLYYSEPDVRLYFTEPYVERFFMDWAGVGGSDDIASSLELEILDPGTNPNPPAWETPDPAKAVVAGSGRADGILHATVKNLTFELDPRPIVSRDVQMLANIVALGPDCGGPLATPEPPGSFVRAEAENLRPRALYTASWRANFEGRTQEVHQYQFLTSRYASHAEQVHSYIQLPAPPAPDNDSLEQDDSDKPVALVANMAMLGDAKFEVFDASARPSTSTTSVNTSAASPASTAPVAVAEPRQPPVVFQHSLDGPVTPSDIASVVNNTVDDSLRQEYATRYDQLHYGVLDVNSLPACTETDFTAIVEDIKSKAGSGTTSDDDQDPEVETHALLIRNPEPFMDPRLPEATWQRTVSAPGVEAVVAPDTARALLVHPTGKPIPAGELDVTFEFWCFSSVGLELMSSEVVTVTVPGKVPEPPTVVKATKLLNASQIGTAQRGTVSKDEDIDGNG